MATVYVNDKPVDIGTEKLNLIQAADKAGVFIPRYCWHPALTRRRQLPDVPGRGRREEARRHGGHAAARRAGLPDARQGRHRHRHRQPQGQGGPAADARRFAAQSSARLPGVRQGRRVHAAGLQLPLRQRREPDGRRQEHPPNKDYIGEHITLFTDRCIMCSRCVRFTREISGTAELQVISRGHHSEIDIFPGEPVNNKLAGNVVDLCPVGALCSKDFLYKQRVWFLKDAEERLPRVQHRLQHPRRSQQGHRLPPQPRENPQAQGHFMCDEGRFDYAYINDRGRLAAAAGRRIRANRSLRPWEKALPLLREELAKAVSSKPGSVAARAVAVSHCRGRLSAGPALQGVLEGMPAFPRLGADARRGRPLSEGPQGPQPSGTVKFTIRAEKCPNRRGIEKILEHFQGEVLAFDKALAAAAHGQLQALYLTAGYPPRLGSWLTAEQIEGLKKVPLLVVQDLFASPVSAVARYVLPAASFAEKDGCFVNHADLAQAIHWAVRPERFGKTDGQVFLDLAQRRGLVHAETIRKELAAEIPFFAPLAVGDLGEHGVRLGVSGH